MNRIRPSFRSAVFVFLVAVGCSHAQKVTPAPMAAAQKPAERPATPQRSADLGSVPTISKNKEGEAIYFDFDSALLRDDARPVLQGLAETARQQEKSVKVEGNCDEVGTIEYNLALGDQRARAAREYLVHMGVRPDRITTVSYGSQRPKYPGHDEGAWAKNRRDDLVVK